MWCRNGFGDRTAVKTVVPVGPATDGAEPRVETVDSSGLRLPEPPDRGSGTVPLSELAADGSGSRRSANVSKRDNLTPCVDASASVRPAGGDGDIVVSGESA